MPKQVYLQRRKCGCLNVILLTEIAEKIISKDQTSKKNAKQSLIRYITTYSLTKHLVMNPLRQETRECI